MRPNELPELRRAPSAVARLHRLGASCPVGVAIPAPRLFPPGLRFNWAQAAALALLLCMVSPASGQVLFPRDYGDGQTFSFSGGQAGGTYELRVLSPDGSSGLVAAGNAFLDVTFPSHTEVKVAPRNVTPDVYAGFHTVITSTGKSQLQAGVYDAGTNMVVDPTHPFQIEAVYDPSPQFGSATFAGNQQWTTGSRAVPENTPKTFSFSWTALDAGTKTWGVGNSGNPIYCQIATNDVARLTDLTTHDSNLATVVAGETDTTGTSGNVSIEFTAPSYDSTSSNLYTVRIHSYQDPYSVGGEGSPTGCTGSALDVLFTVRRNVAPVKPAKPTLAAVSGSSTTLTVTWVKPDLNDGPDITDYNVEFREGTSGTWRSFSHSGPAVTTTLTGLTANTSYQARVQAVNGETDSEWSDPSNAVSTNAETSTAPTITDVAVTSTPAATDTYGAGETIEVSVTFSEAVTATTGTDFVLSVGGAKRAPLLRGSGTATLVFGYTVLAADADDNGIWIGDQDRTLVGNRNGDPQNGTITSETTDVEADLTHAALGQQSGHKVDGSLSGPEPVDPVEPPEVTLHLSDADGEVGEDAGAVTVTATVSPASATAFTVTVSASPVAPATDDDFELSTNRALSFAANATASSGTVTIAPVDDGDPESNQVVTVSGSASIEGVTGPDDVTLTILDNDLVSIRGICNRTPRVRDRILVLLKNRHSFKDGCSGVTETQLAQLQSLDLGRNPSTESAVTMSLRSNDFEGLVNLERLYLRETGLSLLPAGVFSGLAALETLELDSNRLRSLPAGVFSDLHSLKTLELHRNPLLSSLPYDEFEALPNLTKLLVDPEGRRGYQVAGGEGDVTLEVAAGRRTTYQVRLTHTPAYVTSPQPTLTVSSDTVGVIAVPVTLRFTKENWFRRQTVTVYATVSAAGATATLSHTSVAVTYDRPIPTVTVRVLENAPGRTADPLTAAFEGLPSSHDGETAFSFRIAFSEAVAVTPEAMRTRVLEVAGGAVTGAARVDGESGVWSIMVTPATREELLITLARSADCAADGAVCTSDGRALSSGAAAIVIGPAERNTVATGTPAIGGTAQVGEELTASTSGISDADGLDNASFGYQWIRTNTDIGGATGATYTSEAADEGKRLKVRVSFTDDAGNAESLTSAATDAVAARPEPLTASFEGMPAEHAGQGSFSFRVAFSEGINTSYKTVRDASFPGDWR